MLMGCNLLDKEFLSLYAPVSHVFIGFYSFDSLLATHLAKHIKCTVQHISAIQIPCDVTSIKLWLTKNKGGRSPPVEVATMGKLLPTLCERISNRLL